MPLSVVGIPLGEWLPDAPDYKNPGCLTADNCFPTTGGYSPFSGGTATGDSIAEAVRGAAQFFRSDGTPLVVGGSSTKLLALVSGTLTETTGLTAIGADESWSFTQFNARVFAAAPNNAIKTLTDVDSDVTWGNAGGSPPQARHIARVGNHLVAANLSGLSLPFSFQSSAENDPTDWPTPGTTDARLKSAVRGSVQREYGPITGMAGDRYPLLFQQRAISRFDPVGPPTVFRIGTIEEARGCIAPRSIVTVGFLTFFLAHDGFWATDGNTVEPIGTRRINEWFAANVSEADRFRTHGAVSWKDQAIVWAFYPADDATGYKRQIVYSWAENRWSTGSLEVDWLVANEVTNPISAAESHVLSAFIQDGSGNSEFNNLVGGNLEATWETADHEPKPGHRVAVNAIYPLIEAIEPGSLGLESGGVLLLESGDELLRQTGLITAGLVTRGQVDTTAPTESALTAVNAAGFCPVRGDGRFARAKLVAEAGTEWNKATGCQLEFRVSGRR